MSEHGATGGGEAAGISRRRVLAAMAVTAGALARPGRAAAEPSAAPQTKCSIRVAAVSYSPPFHDHRSKGVNLDAVREMTAKVAKERPDFICFPEACACIGGGFDKGIETAPELEPFVAEMGKIAREFDTALVLPFLERSQGKVYNSVPIVDRQGKFVLAYHKNYPTIGEMEAGITPGTEAPVGECDGVRVGAAVCFDANFDELAARLEQQRARLVFWPSMYWGGRLLQHWSTRYGFALVAAYGTESSIVDMNGQFLAKRGAETFKVRQKLLPPWAVADIRINRELYHLDKNQNHFPAMQEKFGPDIDIELFEPEGYFLLSSNRPDLPVEQVATEFGLETLRDYLARSVRIRNEKLKAT